MLNVHQGVCEEKRYKKNLLIQIIKSYLNFLPELK